MTTLETKVLEQINKDLEAIIGYQYEIYDKLLAAMNTAEIDPKVSAMPLDVLHAMLGKNRTSVHGITSWLNALKDNK